MKLADMIDLESIATSVQVQVLSPAPYENNNFDTLNIKVFSFYRGENALFSKFWSVQSKKIEHNSVSKLLLCLGLDNKIKQMVRFGMC